jgi:hypothetical protein
MVLKRFALKSLLKASTLNVESVDDQYGISVFTRWVFF